MLPLRVEIHLATPIVVPSHVKCFDGLLAWARVEEAKEQGLRTVQAFAAQHDLPLERFDVNGQWVFKASAFEFAWSGDPFESHRIKRQKVSDYAASWRGGEGAIESSRGGRITVDVSSGPTKAGLYPQMLRQCDVATAWCVGDATQVERLMRYVSTFGKGYNRGKGIVKRVAVVEDVAAVQRWRRRPLPKDAPLDDSERPLYALGAHPLYPPYWDTKNAEVCHLPLSELPVFL